MYNRTKNLMIQIHKISRNKGKRRKAHLKLKEWEPTSCRIKKPKSKKLSFPMIVMSTIKTMDTPTLKLKKTI
jgi:hypothetical protein